MGHNLASLGTASLDSFGGLITFAAATDLPEGASPRTWDTDFIIGAVFTRPGLNSVYTYTNVLNINTVQISYGIGTFTYDAQDTAPLVNEQFMLNAFTDSVTGLNGLTVTVLSVDTVNYTFTAFVALSNVGPIVGLTGTATSTTGNFVGPNLGGSQNVVAIGGNPWTNPAGILGNVTYASATTGNTLIGTVTPSLAANQSATNPWTSPINVVSSVTFASINLSPGAGAVSSPMLINHINLDLPSDATVTGISFSSRSQAVGAGGLGRLKVQLATNGNGIGTEVTVPMASTLTTLVQGSSTYQWGTTLTPEVVNGAAFGILLTSYVLSPASASVFIHAASVSVYYTTSSGSEELQVKTFTFTLPSTSGISGFGASFQAFSSASTTVSMRMLKAGIAVGETRSQVVSSASPTIYSLGGANDLWGDTWVYSDANNTNFGVQVTVSGLGTTSINDLDLLVYLTPGLSNFNYIKSFEQNNGQLYTLALDSSGIIWLENVNQSPNTLHVGLTGIEAGSFARSATMDDQEFITFSDLTIGTDRPRVFDGSVFSPLSQVGPGAPPAFAPASGNTSTSLNITAFQITSNEVTFTFDAGPTVVADEVYSITGAVPSYLNIVNVVLGTPPPTATTMTMPLTHANVVLTPVTAVGTLQFNYPITSITQNGQHPTNGPDNGGIFWGAGPGPTHTPGSNLVIYYSSSAEDTVLTKYFAAHPGSTYVYLSSLNHFPQFNGTYLVTSVGKAFPSSTAGAARFYFVVNVGVSGASYPDGSTGNYQMTIATVNTSVAIAGLSTGDSIRVSGETPTAWNSSWSIVEALKSAQLNITATQLSSAGTATYTYSVPSGGAAPVNGQIASITQCNNSAAGYTLSPFNTVGVISNVTGSTFDITGFTSGHPVPFAVENPGGIAETYGTQFTIDPGAGTLGTATNPIYGNGGASSAAGGIAIVNGTGVTPIGQGTRQGVVFFITDSDYETFPSPAAVFTIPSNTSAIHVTNIPIGPPNVKGRGIAFTEAGQNGVPGANFYVIRNPVTIQVQNGAPVTYSSTIINDNVTTSADFKFTDAVLLNSEEVDVQGNDLFNLIELGSSAWCIPYAARMFYGLQLNKVDNFLNLSFDGGYLPNVTTGGNIFPLGWQSLAGGVGTTLIDSTVTGQALRIFNSTVSTVTNAGLMLQGAYVDSFNTPIILPNTAYSMRITLSCPSAVQSGTLFISFNSYNHNTGFGANWGGQQIPLTSLSTTMQTFDLPMITTPFTKSVPVDLVLAMQVFQMGPGADVVIDRIEIYPTKTPYLTAQVFGSYIDNPEAIDASGTGGIIDTTSENPQACMGAFVMHDNLYLLKTSSLYSTQDNPVSEPGGWGLSEVSNKVGSIGVNSYDVGEEWAVMACRTGIYGFNGGQPTKMMQEIWNLWERINWDAGKTIVLRNDLANRRILCAVPLPTPNPWLPFDPPNPAPTSPNVILMLNYMGLNTAEELFNSPQVHTTMFGSLASVDMKRKWSIWRVKTPYMDFITRADGVSKPLFVGNGIDSSKIYQFLDDQLSDDGVAINGVYTTYGFVNAAKAATLPIFGFHAKRYTVLQTNLTGAGVGNIKCYPNTLDARYPITLRGSRTPGVPGTVSLTDPAMDDIFRPVNLKGNRMFLEFSTNAVGSWFNLSKILLSGKADPWSTLNPTGGGNTGIM